MASQFGTLADCAAEQPAQGPLDILLSPIESRLGKLVGEVAGQVGNLADYTVNQLNRVGGINVQCNQ